MPDRIKNREKHFFSSTQNGPIRKVNMLKSKFDDIFVPTPLRDHPGSTLRNFSTEKNRCFLFEMVQFAKLSNT